MKPVNYVWMPNVGLGEIKFGELFSRHIESGMLSVDQFLGDRFGAHYRDAAKTQSVDEEDGLVSGIRCVETFVYRGMNLIGVKLERAVELIAREPDRIDGPYDLNDDDVQSTAEFDELGLMLWLRDGLVVSASIFEDPGEGE